MNVEDLRCWEGVQKFQAANINAYEPIEDFRVGKSMDDFIDDFCRKRDQDIVD